MRDLGPQLRVTIDYVIATISGTKTFLQFCTKHISRHITQVTVAPGYGGMLRSKFCPPPGRQTL